MPRTDVTITAGYRGTPVLRESDGRMVLLLEVWVVETGKTLFCEVFDPRLEPDESFE